MTDGIGQIADELERVPLRRVVARREDDAARGAGVRDELRAAAGLGYRYGDQSRKAIWHEFGTPRLNAKHMAQKTYDSIKENVASDLSRQLAAALERASSEVAVGKNKGYGG